MNCKYAIPVLLTFLISVLPLIGHAKNMKKSGDFYEVSVETRTTGDKSVATVTATPRNGYHCNMQYPWKLTIVESDGLKTAKTVLRKADAKKFGQDAVVFEVPYSVPQGKEVKGALKFSMCDEKQCKMERLELSL